MISISTLIIFSSVCKLTGHGIVENRTIDADIDIPHAAVTAFPHCTGHPAFIDRNLKPKKIKKTPKNGCLFNTSCVP